MNDNPYRPPDSNYGSGPPKRNSAAWITIFFITAVIVSLNVLGASLLASGTVLDYVSLGISVISTVGLYGFAFYKLILNVVFWRYFFYLAILDMIVFNLIYPIFGFEFFGTVVTVDWSFLIWTAFNITIIYGLNQYAYKRPFIWQKDQ